MYSGTITTVEARAGAPSVGVLFANRAAACAAVEDVEGALQDCDRALEANPYYGKAYARRAQLYKQRGEWRAAIADAATAQVLSPSPAQEADALATLRLNEASVSKMVA